MPSSYRFKNIMLVDDSDIDNYINKKVLGRSRFAREVNVKSSADEALETLRHLVKEDRADAIPQVIFVDLGMPDKDGFEFIQEFRLFPEKVTESVLIVVLTSSIDPFDEERVAELGGKIRFIQKPLTSLKLEQL